MDYIKNIFGEQSFSDSIISERRKKIALALKKKMVDETSAMGAAGGGAIEGGYSKPVDEEGKDPADDKKSLGGNIIGGSVGVGGGTHSFEDEEESKLSEGLQYHLDNNISLCENIYRPYSEKYLLTIKEARRLYKEGKLEVKGLDKWLLANTDVGEYGIFEGKRVPLDMPFAEELEGALLESEKKKPSKPMNQPFRSSGPKKYAVYVRSKSGGVKKVNFGDAKGGLKSKITDPAARKSFVARHKCTQTHDKTTAGYWACRLPRYAERLGLAKVGAAWW